MERPNFVENGGFKLPIGYRFHPTDEELVVHYLKRKVLGLPMPASVIPEFDVFQNDPSSLPGNLKEKRYFFSQMKLNDFGTKCKRPAGSGPSGYWKPIGKGKQIVASDSSKVVGTRKTLVFKERKHSIKTRSQWFMHGYCLAGSATGPKTTQMEEVGDWVAYSVFQRKRKPRKNVVVSNPSNINETRNIEIISPSFMDFMMEQSSDGVGPPSPCSSGVTEVSPNEVDQEEISSSSISLFSYPCNRKRT
ncbi:hypothetical protein D5086_030414 [Populus alba]|uniref:Uncharacterized protein n=2 Tax=Populus TaxID=3689 RepID=A0ACC4ANF0_POPAL|nr:NAC domain-containing protein 83-like [Populus alba]KAJ6959603.1 NAC domain-containing protein 83-like [Populus alba x Populus x berolinensis]